MVTHTRRHTRIHLHRLAGLALIVSFIVCGRVPGADEATKPAAPALYGAARGAETVVKAVNLELAHASRDEPLGLRISYPKRIPDAGEARYPIIIFSHGMGGSANGYDPLIEHWVSHGYVVIQPTHADSISLLNTEDRRAIRSAKQYVRDPQNSKNWKQRPEEIALLMDELDALEAFVPDLAARWDRDTIGVGGHSFGAHTAQLMGGLSLKMPQRMRDTRRRGATDRRFEIADARPQAILAISPQGRGESIDDKSWQGMTRPTMFITGSHDTSPRNDHSASWRLDAFNFSPAGDRYLCFIDGAYHNFGGISGVVRREDAGPQNDDHVQYVRSASLAFWDAWLKKNETARAWLDGDAMHETTQGAARLMKKTAATEGEATN
jgi:predicted dienelactone hydrolase